MSGTGAYALDQTPDQHQVAMVVERASKPPPRLDQHRQRHPHDAALFRDATLVSLHLPQVTRWLDQILVNGLALAARPRPPGCHRALVESKRGDDHLQWAAMGKQGHDNDHERRRGPQSVEDRACRCREGLVAQLTDEPLVRARVDAEIACTAMASAGAPQIGAEYR
jgi:hypothetical protein